MLTRATLTVGFYRLVPEAAPAPEFVPRGLFALLWIVIALKGAGIGKLTPGSGMGLRVSWTKQSRLAWDRGHRALGRILFWGGLIGLATSLVVSPVDLNVAVGSHRRAGGHDGTDRKLALVAPRSRPRGRATRMIAS
jgi:hypothetical protein